VGQAGQRRHRDAPYLARYMGHASIESSYYYIHTSPDFMHAYDITAASQSLLPQVGFE
jgi:integrase